MRVIVLANRTVPTMARQQNATTTAHPKRKLNLAALGLGSLLGLVPVALAGNSVGAECDQLSIPAVSISRCVVEGGTPEIDAGNVVRFDALSSDTVHWLAGHRTTHGSTFGALLGIGMGDEVTYRSRTFTVVDYAQVNRFQPPNEVVDWVYSQASSLVLQTSMNATYVHVWRAIETAPIPAPPVDRPGPTTNPVGPAVGLQIVRPVRVYDSRMLPSRESGGSTHVIQIPESVGLPSDAVAVFANVTVVGVSQSGFAAAGLCGSERPQTSNVNWTTPVAVANLSLIEVTAGDFCIYLTGSADVIVDLVGFATGSATLGFEAVPPTRIYDTRTNQPTSLSAGETRRIVLPHVLRAKSPAGVGVTVTAVSDEPGYVSIHACGDSGHRTSTVNIVGPAHVANSVIAPVASDGTFCVTTLGAADVILDVNSMYIEGGARLQMVHPVRMADTRITDSVDLNRGLMGSRLGDRSVLSIAVESTRGLPSNVGIVANITSVDSTDMGYITVWDCNDPRQTTSVQNPRRGEVIGSSVAIGVEGTLCVYTLRSSHVVVDVMGVWVR